MMDTRIYNPWYTLWRKIYFTLSQDEEVYVSGLNKENDNKYNIVITAKKMHTAYALSKIIKQVFTFGNVKVDIIVRNNNIDVSQDTKEDEQFTDEELCLLICEAFRNNKLFKGVVLVPKKEESLFAGKVVILFAKEVVQFYNYDVTDIFGNFNELAAHVFADIIKFMYKDKQDKDIFVLCNTYDKNAIDEDDLFCI